MAAAAPCTGCAWWKDAARARSDGAPTAASTAAAAAPRIGAIGVAAAVAAPFRRQPRRVMQRQECVARDRCRHFCAAVPQRRRKILTQPFRPPKVSSPPRASAAATGACATNAPCGQAWRAWQQALRVAAWPRSSGGNADRARHNGEGNGLCRCSAGHPAMRRPSPGAPLPSGAVAVSARWRPSADPSRPAPRAGQALRLRSRALR
mmetsp:Transcript_30024/g.89055  ORF Transcript_30024/g.89055 Transcript_30024/m.89055 type:complete len:206 (+) Transcript_30024:708-1325(+)|eukprot:366438-Chlamydomonas_euryale.AAC.9